MQEAELSGVPFGVLLDDAADCHVVNLEALLVLGGLPPNLSFIDRAHALKYINRIFVEVFVGGLGGHGVLPVLLFALGFLFLWFGRFDLFSWHWIFTIGKERWLQRVTLLKIGSVVVLDLLDEAGIVVGDLLS